MNKNDELYELSNESDESNEVKPVNDAEADDISFREAAEGVIRYFAGIAAVPHDSGHEEALAAEMSEWFSELDGISSIDDYGNLICDIPPSEGYENAPMLMLQGHMDMVCAARAGSDWDPLSDHVTLRARADRQTGRMVLCSDGSSSLGADCGLGDAAVLWALKNAKKHGPVRILMTVQEETGLVGAGNIDKSVLNDVKFLINVDGFAGGVFIGGSAGGRREDYSRPLCAVRPAAAAASCAAPYKRCILSLSGFRGGHSGYDIDRGRANPVKLLSGMLYELARGGAEFDIASLNGGLKHNVIPSECRADIIIPEAELSALEERAAELENQIRIKYAKTDGEGSLHIQIYDTGKEISTAGEAGLPLPEAVISRSDRDALLHFAASLHTGVYRYMKELPDHVDTSCNLGRIICDAVAASDGMHVLVFERSSSAQWHDELLRLHSAAAKATGFVLSGLEEYGPWSFQKDDPLMNAAVEEYERVTGRRAVKSAVHVGLEPSVLGAKNPKMKMINMGADVLDPHTVNERVNIDSIGPFALTLAALIERAAEDRI